MRNDHALISVKRKWSKKRERGEREGNEREGEGGRGGSARRDDWEGKGARLRVDEGGSGKKVSIRRVFRSSDGRSGGVHEGWEGGRKAARLSTSNVERPSLKARPLSRS